MVTDRPTGLGDASEPSDIFALLRREHQQASSLLQKLTDGDNAEQPDELFFELRAALEVHASAAEKVFYGELRHFRQFCELVREATHEHEEIVRLLDELAEMSCGEEEWQATILQLKDALAHHVQQEESEIFNIARHVLTMRQTKELACEMDAEEKRLKHAA